MRIKTLAFCAVLLGLSALAGRPARAGEIAWGNSLSKAMAQAKAQNKLVMIDFYTDWCVWCKRLDKDTYPNAQVVQTAKQFVAVKVNAEKEGLAAAKKYNVSGFPTILFVNGSGEVEGRINGYMTPEPFRAELLKIQTAHVELPDLIARVGKNPRDAAAAAKLTGVYAGRGDAARATKMLNQAAAADPGNATGQIAKAYAAVGDLHQNNNNFAQAVPLFRKSAAVAKTPYDRGYAHISAAVCLLQQNDLKRAKPELQAVVAVPNCPPDMKKQATQILDAMKKRGM